MTAKRIYRDSSKNDSDDKYVLTDHGRKLKTGFTTGSCATAAAKAALLILEKIEVDEIEIMLPNQALITIPIHKVIRNSDGSVTCSVLKDAGDDHDVTHGIEIRATVLKTSEVKGIEILGGKGVGMVMKKGLQIPVGQPAINPAPLKMIHDNLTSIIKGDDGIRVTISVPEGEQVALKTFNPRLGIEGGISIIGTTGIVRPMSEDAFKATIFTELSQKFELGVRNIVLVPGQHGEKYAMERHFISEEHIVHVGNFLGFSLSAAVKLGFKSILLIGHIGKLIKLAAGIFNTHSKVADAKAHILVTHMALKEAPLWKLNQIFKANTTDEMSELVHQWGDQSVFLEIGKAAKMYAEKYVFKEIPVEIILYDMSGRELCDTRKADEESA